MTTVDFDPLAPETFDSFHREFTELRARCPVARSDAWNGFWALLRYDDVLAAAGDPALFTTTVQNVVPKLAFTGRRPPLHLDPPEHTPYRRALNPYFTPAKMEAIEPALRADRGRPARPARRRRRRRLLRRVHAPAAGLRLRRVLQPDARARDGDPRGDPRVRRRGAAVRARGREAHEPGALRHRADDHRHASRRAARPGRGSRPADCSRRGSTASRCPDDLLLGTIRQFIVVGMVAPCVFIGIDARPPGARTRSCRRSCERIRRSCRRRSRSTCGCSRRTAASRAPRPATSRSAAG